MRQKTKSRTTNPIQDGGQKYLKTQEKLKEFEIMYQNAIYICIS